MRLLYVSRTNGVHDLRFLDGWKASGATTASLAIDSPHGTATSVLASINRFQPNVVQVGPLTWPGPAVVAAWNGPLIATSWGFDLLQEVQQSAASRDAARQVLKRADVLLVDNDAIGSRSIELGADPASLIQFPWGLDPKWLAQPTRVKRTAERTVFLTTRRHEGLYRTHDILDAFILSADGEHRSELWIANVGSQTNKLHRRAADSPFRDRIRFLGEQSQDELRDLFSQADVYVTASSVDGSSVSLLEAMVSGVTVLASRIPGNAQWVTAKTGFGFEMGNVAELANCMKSFTHGLLDSEAARRSRNASGLVRERANWERTIDRFPSIAQLALDRRRSRMAV